MPDKHLHESCLDSQTVFTGKLLNVKCDSVRLPDGSTSTREYIVHPGAVVIIPLLDAQTLVLERQFRYPVAATMLEFPAGKLDPQEPPLACAQRELREETGYLAAEWAYAGKLHLAIAYSTEVLHVYFARGLSLQQRQLDAGEFLEVYTQNINAFLRDCDSGSITDAKTLSCAYHLQRFVLGQTTLDWLAV